MSELAAFQDRFVAAMHRDAPLTAQDDDALRRGLGVYRNTIYKALIDALSDNYPTVQRLVGAEWFAASAYDYLSTHSPRDAALVTFGEDYPDFLRALPATAEIPYLPGVAALDRYWIEAHVAADAPALSPQMLAGVAADRLFDLSAPLHASARIAWFEAPAPSIWRLNRPPAPPAEEMDVEWIAEGALIARPGAEVDMMILDRAGFVFLDKCREGATFGEAATAAMAVAPEADLVSQIARFIAFGAFAAQTNIANLTK